MEGGGNKSPSEAIIVLSSDDDEDEDVQEVFKQFISKVQRYVPHHIIVFLKLKFAEARSDFVSSANFKRSLKWRTRQLDESNGYIYTGHICKLLGADLKHDESKPKTEGAKKESCDGGYRSTRNDVSMHSTRVESDVNKEAMRQTTDHGDGNSSGSFVLKITNEQTATQTRPSTSTAQSPSKRVEINKGGKTRVHQATKPHTPRKRQLLIKRLKEKLKHVADKIKILNQAELSLDEMKLSDSTYIQECRLKERFNKLWTKLCKIQGRPTDTGRVTEKDVKCPSTGFPEIDRAVNKFLKKKRGRFPDKFDIANVIVNAKKEHGLKVSSQALREISDDVFVAIGNKLQQRRKLDFVKNFGCHLTDDYCTNNDPAITDLALQKKLEDNKRMGKRALEDVFNRYAHYGRMKNDEGSGFSSSSDSEKEKLQNSKMKKKFSHISIPEPSDSSENECDNFGLEIEDPNGSEISDCKSPSGNNKTRTVRKLSYTNENDLDDFVVKRPRRHTERANHTESKDRQSVEYHDLPKSKEIEPSSDCAVVELPSSVLSECVSIKQAEVVDMHKKGCDDEEATTAGHDVLENPEFRSAQNIPQSDDKAFENLQINDFVESLNSDLDNEDLPTTSGSDNISASNNDQVGTGSSLIAPDILANAVASSSGISNDLNMKNNTETPNKESGKQDTVSPSNSVSQKQSDNPNIAQRVSLKDRKASLISLSTRKRKGESGSLEYESPLKVFRNATLEIVGKKDNVLNAKRDTPEQKKVCDKITSSSESEDDELYITGTNGLPGQSAVNGHSPVQKHEWKRSVLSLNKHGRNHQKKQKVTVSVSDEIIVLSDDE